MKAIARDLRLPDMGPHGLRHSWATAALRAGINPKIVSERLGHSTIGITLDVYQHAVPGLESDAAEQVASLLLGEAGEGRS